MGVEGGIGMGGVNGLNWLARDGWGWLAGGVGWLGGAGWWVVLPVVCGGLGSLVGGLGGVGSGWVG